MKWNRLSVDQSYAVAQYNLGWMYANGTGVLQDYVEAVKWYRLAADQGYESAIKNRDIVAGKMTPSQIKEAQRLAWEWLAAHP